MQNSPPLMPATQKRPKLLTPPPIQPRIATPMHQAMGLKDGRITKFLMVACQEGKLTLAQI
jgi:hypothetical protein